MGQYSIKEVETLSGVKAHTLRIWEQRYDFLKPKRTDTNIRYYTDEQLRMLLNIGTLNRNGMKISKIAELGKEELSKQVSDIYHTAAQPDNLQDSLIHAMLDFDEARFEKILSASLIKMGFEEAFTQLVFPFMIRTGVLWATGSVRVAQEHFIANLIRRKLYVAIDNQQPVITKHSKKFLLFLPEGETHELLLLFTEFVLRNRNHQVIYIGAFTPFDELAFLAKSIHPDYLVTFLTVPVQEMDLPAYLKKISSVAPGLVFIGGLQTENLQVKLPHNCRIINSMEALLTSVK